MGIFKSKPGGTFTGNLIRGAANKFSGGVLGNGAMMRNAQNNATKEPLIDVTLVKNGAYDAIGTAIDNTPHVKKAIAQTIIEKYWMHALAVVALIVSLTLIIKNKTKKTRYGR